MHEIKFDGYRLLARIDGGKVRLKTRSGLDWTAKFASVQKALEKLPVVTAFLDGEVMVETEQRHAGLRHPAAGLERGPQRPLLLLPVRPPASRRHRSHARRADRPQGALSQLLAGRDDGVLKLSEHFTEKGDIVLRHACRLSLEGIVSKLATAPYRSGRSKAWLKSKCTDSDEFVVIGYVPSTTQRRTVGSLALGYFDKGKLVYAGRVGSGFSTAVADDLWRRLEAIRIEAPALDPLPPVEARRNVRWVKPQLVAEVEMRGWTADGILRHAVFKGLRQDKEAADVAPEKPIVKSKPKASKAQTKSAPAPAVPLTHPDRVLWPDVGVTKQGLAEFYTEIWPQIAPHVVDRPLALVRCPGGVEEGCFFQKHAWAGISEHISRSRDPDDGEELLSIDSLEGLISLVQASVLEIHVWGAKLADIETPDGITFDLDPAPEVAWADVIAAAFEVRERLEELGLQVVREDHGRQGPARLCAARAARRLGRREGLLAQARRRHGQGQPATLPGYRLEGRPPGSHLRRLPAQRPRRHGRRRLLGPRAGGRRRLDAARLGRARAGDAPGSVHGHQPAEPARQYRRSLAQHAQERAPPAVLEQDRFSSNHLPRLTSG